MINDNNDEYNELKDEYVDLLGKVKAQPLEARQKLPKLKNDKRLKRMINILDKVVEETSQDNMDLTTINHKQYTAALVKTNKILPPKPQYKKTQRGRPPAWQQRLHRQIDQLRGEISIITEYTKGNSTNKTRRKLKKILKKHKVASEDQLTACKEDLKQALQSKAILENCKAKKKNVSTAWIDYKKAFDSVPHSWILRCLQMYKIHPVLIEFIEQSMNHWKTNMTLVHKEGVLETGPIRIKRGIFQGDSLSPLLFTMSLTPLSIELNKTKYGYQLDKQTKINHLFYVDDLKLYGTNDNQLAGLINTVKHISDDTKMEFGLDKCAKATFKRGKKVQAEGIQLNDNQVIQDLEQSETYKYLGMEEGEGLQHHEMKGKIQKEYKRRVKLVLKSELNARNKIAAINTLAVPVIVYSYGIINWKLDEIQNLDRMTRKQLCMNRMLAKKADIDRIYLPCPEGGRSLMNLEIEYKATMVGLHKYMTGKNDPQIQAVLRHHNSKALYSVPKEAAKYLNEAGTIQDLTIDINRTATWKAKQLKLKYKKDAKKIIKNKRKDKAMHGKFPKYLDKDHIDMQLSFEWMKHTGLKGETEGLITAAQDQALNTRYYSKHIIKQGSTDKCRMCNSQQETLEHIISGCQSRAADQYLNRHNQVAAQLHLDICKHYNIAVEAQYWYQHKPEPTGVLS